MEQTLLDRVMTGPHELALDPMIAWLLRFGLALVFAQAAWHKSRDLEAAAQVVADYRVTPVEWAHLHASLATVGEALLAGGLVASGWMPSLGPVTAWGAIVLLGLYSAAIGVNLARGRRDIDCGCAGPAGRSPRIGPWLLVRNGVLAAAALALAALPVSTRPLHWIDAASLLGGVLALALVWVAVHALAASMPVARDGEQA